MRARTMTLAALAGLSLLTLGVVSMVTPASAQTVRTNLAALDLDNADVRDAMRDLFKNSGVSYAVAPNVQGTITLHLRNVPLETALQNAVRQVNATYRVNNGVYEIVPDDGTAPPAGQPAFVPPAQAAPAPPTFAPMGEPPVVVSEGDFLYIVQGGIATKIDKRDMKIVKQVGYAGGGFGR